MNVFLKIHLLTILPVLLTGPILILRTRRDKLHMWMGRIWACLMIISCLFTFGVTGANGNYSWLHGLSLFTIVETIRAVIAIRRKEISKHKRAMVGSYLGAMLAFIFAVAMPERLLNSWISEIIKGF